MRQGSRLVTIVLVILAAHVAEVCLYAVAYAISTHILGIGGFSGRAMTTPLDYLYFSIVTFTSLGLGDVFPIGHVRFLAGIETLNGLLLIAWSGSFIYMAMGRMWPWPPCAVPTDARPPGRED